MNRSSISKLLAWLAVAPGVTGVLFALLAVERGTLPYNSEGNYFDGVVNYHEQSVVVFAILACVSLAVTVALVWAGRRLRARQNIL